MRSKKNQGMVLTVTSQKGGVGKTTTSIILANIFSNFGKKTLLIDLDLYSGNIAFSYNLKLKNNLYNLCDDIFNKRIDSNDYSDYIYKINDNLDVLPGVVDPRNSSKIDNKVLYNIIDNLSYKYEMIIIDTNHVLSPCNMIAFDLSDKIIDIITNDSYNMQSCKSFIAIVKNMGVDNVVLMLNNSLSKDKAYYEIFDVKNITKKKVDYTIPKELYLDNLDEVIVDGKMDEIDRYFKGEARSSYEDFRVHMLSLIGGDDSEK